MASKPVYLTAEGKKRIEEELEYLRKVRRAEIAAEIQSAKEEGDLSENSAYDEAKLAQGFNEGRIQTLEAQLREAILIDQSATDPNVVNLGDKVTVVEVGTEDEEVYQLVGSTEANPSNGRISNESPIGNALLGRRVGDVVLVETPGGQIEFEVRKIEV